MSTEGPKPYSVVYDADSNTVQYSFATGYIQVPLSSFAGITSLTGPLAVGGSPLPGQILGAQSTTAGFGLPVMNTAQRLVLTAVPPAEGTVVYDTDLKQILYWHTSKWDALASVETVPVIDLVGQTADIPDTTIITPLVGGLYTLSGHANQGGGTGVTNPTLSITYTDHIGTNTHVPIGSVPVQHAGTPSSYTFNLYSIAGAPIKYTVAGGSYGTASYDLAIGLIKVS